MKVLKEDENIKIIKLEINIGNTNHVTNTYILIDKLTNKASIIDPAYDGKYLLDVIEKESITLDSVIVTHAHADHIGGISEIQEQLNVPIYIHELDEKGLNDDKINEQEIVKIKVGKIDTSNIKTVKDKDIINIGGIQLEVIHTLGHTKGSIMLYSSKYNIIFSGDTLFSNTYGRTDLYWSDKQKMGDTLDKIFDRFDLVMIYPGHDEEFNLNDAKRKIRLLYAFKG